MLATNFDYQELLLFNISTDSGNIVNASGTPQALVLGTLVGRIGAAGGTFGNIVPQVSTATDGSQVPIGVLVANYTVAGNATQAVTYVIGGEVNTALLKLGGSDTLNTEITDNSTKLGSIKDILQGKGIILKGANQLTYFDPQ